MDISAFFKLRDSVLSFSTLISDIIASSQFGINGTVKINDFMTDPDSGLVELPSGLVDASTQIAKGCASNQGNTFIATGRGGVAALPIETLN